MRSLLSWFSDWVVVHPVLWGVGLAVVLVLLGFALDLSPVVVVAAGAVLGVLTSSREETGLLSTSGRPGYTPGTSGGRVTVPGSSGEIRFRGSAQLVLWSTPATE